ncbi:MAG: hypothetical protein ACFE9L_15020 [Candidatus Hodarchaeota archaeon]
MNKEIKERRKKLAQEQGNRSLSSVIEDLLRMWERDPSILEPTAVMGAPTELINDLNVSFGEFEELDERLRRIEKDIRQIKDALNIEDKDEDVEVIFGDE